VLIAFVVANSSTYAQGNTTSSINGNVYDSSSQSSGASVLATHTASGTRYTATTDIDGNFRISNMSWWSLPDNCLVMLVLCHMT
jgi:hypothetical protein